MPNPAIGETEQEFIERCIPTLISEGKDQDQAYAVCRSIYSTGKDNIPNNIERIKSQIKIALDQQKNEYRIIIDKYIEEVFNDAVRNIPEELINQANVPVDPHRGERVKRILKDNFIQINFELFDAIDKEVGIFLTDVSLNNIPFTNNGLKSEIKKIFDNKSARLMSQIVTETTRAANTAFEWGYKQSGVISHKQWVAIIDGKTTSICRTGNGEVREIGTRYSDGNFQAPHHINCRSADAPLTIDQVEK